MEDDLGICEKKDWFTEKHLDADFKDDNNSCYKTTNLFSYILNKLFYSFKNSQLCIFIEKKCEKLISEKRT